MMRTLYTGLSGTKVHQTKLDVIGNNISNVNTTGFKSSRTTFSNMLSQNIAGAAAGGEGTGGTNPKQVGLGASVGSIDLIYKNGSPMMTGKNTDLCLSGDGLFVVKRGNDTFYTRNGGFEFDASGKYVLPGSGHVVQGWMAKDGVVTPGGSVENIQLKNVGKELEAKATDSVTYFDNLSANVPVVTEISGGESGSASETNPVTLTLSDGTSVVKSSGTYKVGNSLPITTSMKIYDSLGATHEIPVYYIHEGTLDEEGQVSYSGQWLMSLTPDASVTSGQSTTSTFTDAQGNEVTATLSAVELKFDTEGRLSQESESGSTAEIAISYAAPAASATETAAATDDSSSSSTANEVPAAQTVTVDFSELTQFAHSTTINSAGNGYTKGTLSKVDIDSSGIITGTYTNGLRQIEAQVAVARFVNPAGLSKTTNSLYTASNNTGEVKIDSASNLGNTITPGALEMSTVDIANEFAEMILAQRGFQSNSKIITVGDEMVETAVNMKR